MPTGREAIIEDYAQELAQMASEGRKVLSERGLLDDYVKTIDKAPTFLGERGVEGMIINRFREIMDGRSFDEARRKFLFALPQAVDRLVAAHEAVERAEKEWAEASAHLKDVASSDPSEEFIFPLVHDNYIIDVSFEGNPRGFYELSAFKTLRKISEQGVGLD